MCKEGNDMVWEVFISKLFLVEKCISDFRLFYVWVFCYIGLIVLWGGWLYNNLCLD